MSLSRRHLLQSASALGALGLIGCKEASVKTPVTEGTQTVSKLANEAATAALDGAKTFMLNAYPETASSMGIDKGEYASLRGKLADRSPEGQTKIANAAKGVLKDLKAIETDKLSPELALDIEVVSSVFERGVDGFDFPYGDMALLNLNWSYRNSPYVAAQNTGAFIEIPSFLGSSHALDTAASGEDYVSRMQAYAKQLDGETDRIQRDGEAGMILPDFLLEKTIDQLKIARAQNPADWSLLKNLTNSAIKSEALERDALSLIHI